MIGYEREREREREKRLGIGGSTTQEYVIWLGVDWSWMVEIGSWSFGGEVKKREEQRSITAITECALRDWLETRGLVW